MVQFLSINFFSWISSIFVGVFKSSRFFVSPCTSCSLFPSLLPLFFNFFFYSSFVLLSFPYTIFFPLFLTNSTGVIFQVITAMSINITVFGLWPRVVCYISINLKHKSSACICILSYYVSNHTASHPIESRLITIFLFDSRSK